MEIGIYLSVLLILFGGVALSVFFKDWKHLESSGSLVVIVGVLITWSDITGNIDQYIYSMKEQANSQLENLNKDKEDGFMSKAAINKMEEFLQNDSDEIQKYLKLRKVRIRRFEAGALIIGTFIWGYGGTIADSIYVFA